MHARMQVTAPNGGTIWFERDAQSAALRAAADLAFAATRDQPSSDSSSDSSGGDTSLVASADDPNTDTSVLSTLQKNAPIVSAAAGLINAGAATSMLAINIANLIAQKADGTVPGSLEIEITNASDSTVVVYAVDPNKGDVAKIPQPIGKDGSDILLLTRPGGFNANDTDGTSIKMSMLVMGIDVVVTYKLSAAAVWTISIAVAGAAAQGFTPGTSLIGVTYTDSVTAFSLYTTGLTSKTGQIDLIVFDTDLDAAALTPTPPPSGAVLTFLTDAKTTGQLAAADLEALQAPPPNSMSNSTPSGPSAFFFPALIPIATAVFGTVTAAANIGNLGFGVASLLGGDPKKADTLEISITNNSTQPVVVASVTTTRAQDLIIRMPTPLGEGESDTVALSNPEGFAKDASKGDGTKLTLSLIVGGLALDLSYEWTSTGSPGRWKVRASSGTSSQDFDTLLQLVGVDYSATSGAFRLYTMPTETSTGQIDITVYDRSS